MLQIQFQFILYHNLSNGSNVGLKQLIDLVADRLSSLLTLPYFWKIIGHGC